MRISLNVLNEGIEPIMLGVFNIRKGKHCYISLFFFFFNFNRHTKEIHDFKNTETCLYVYCDRCDPCQSFILFSVIDRSNGIIIRKLNVDIIVRKRKI